MATSGSEAEKLAYSWGKICVGVNQGKGRCSREPEDDFVEKKIEAQRE